MRSTPDQNTPIIAVLGASGYVGSAVSAYLALSPVALRLAARGPVPLPSEGPAEVERYTGDLTAAGSLARVVHGADVVLHLVRHNTGAATWRVAEGDRDSDRVNLGLVTDLVDVLRDDRRPGPPPAVLLAGSTSLSIPRAGPARDGPAPPATIYDRQKAAAERVLRDATAEGVLQGATLRLPTVFGGSMVADAHDVGVVSAMARCALAGESLNLWNDGTVERDLLFVDDAARAFAAALDHTDALAGDHWDIGTGHGIPLGKLFRMIADTVARHTGEPPVPVRSVPPPPEATATDSVSCVADPSGFQEVTGWSPRLPLRRGLEHTVAALARERGGGRTRPPRW